MPTKCIQCVNLYYEIFGNGSKVLLFLPGFLGTIEADFGPLIEQMDKTVFTVVSWDPPGYGRSQPFQRKFTKEFLEDDAVLAAELMESLGFYIYSILGWSHGGATGIYMAGNHPYKVERLVTFGVSSIGSACNTLYVKALQGVHNWPEDKLETYLKYNSIKQLQTLCDTYLKLVSNVITIEWKFSKRHLDKVSCPMIILHAEQDKSSPVENGKFLQSIKPDATLKILMKGGHDSHLVYPAEFANIISNFFEPSDV